MAEVKIVGSWYSPFSSRVEMGLKMKGVDYEFINVDLRNKSDLLLKYNPVHKKVPVLLHNGKSIPESMIILEYIDEAFPGPRIWPTDPYERAQARFWAKFVDDKCVPTMWKACWSTGEERDEAKEEAQHHLKFLENEIKDKKFFGGDSIGPVDIAANFIAYWYWVAAEIVSLHLITKEEFPKLCEWADEFCNSSSVKDHLPAKEELAEGFKVALKAAAASKGTSSV